MRQQKRKALFNSYFDRYICSDNNPLPKDLQPRSERRKLARAYAARDWKAEVKARA